MGQVHISSFQIFAVCCALAFLCGAGWAILVAIRKNDNTRERFAFASLAALVPIVAAATSALADKQTILGEFLDFSRAIRNLPVQPDPPHVADHMMMLVIIGLFVYFVVHVYDNWSGAISVRQYDKARFHEPTPWLTEGIREARRVLTGQPKLKVLDQQKGKILPSALEQPQRSLAWHVDVRDLLSLRFSSYYFDKSADWHEQLHCWIGMNKSANNAVAVLCCDEEPGIDSLSAFVRYVRRVTKKNRATDDAEYILATRSVAPTGTLTIDGAAIRRENANSLLEQLVDFSDYFIDIRNRVEKNGLPDSTLKLIDVYVPPRCRAEKTEKPVDLESYLSEWLAEPGSRHIALLGEYGQGKSTAALMTAYRIANSKQQIDRIPILIELRGRSPRNMTPEDLVAAWAFPYRINAHAVMKLIEAGKVVLILEGFDEMALVGDPETRLAHFQVLWKFCFPLAKIMITGRPNFFLDDREMRSALGIYRSVSSGPFCEALHLHPFNIQQIEHALRKSPDQTRFEIVKLARKDEKFKEIVARGSLLYVVSQLWEREQLSKHAGRITSAFVMDLFIQHSYQRQSSKAAEGPQFMVLNASERQYFMLGIAAFMSSLELPNQITKEQFDRSIKTLFEMIPKSASSARGGLPKMPEKPLAERLGNSEEPLQEVSNDVRSTGILVFDQTKSGALRFAHKSFLEYLAAKVYAGSLKSDGEESRAAALAIVTASQLKSRHISESKESIAFFAEILVGSLEMNEQVSARQALPKVLFEAIVVKPAGGGFLASVLAKSNLYAMKRSARHTQQKQSKNLYEKWRYLASSLGAFTLGIILFVSSAFYLATSLNHDIHLQLSSAAELGLASGALAISIIQAVSLEAIGRAYASAIRLWFAACWTLGVKGDEFGPLISRRDVVAISRDLGLEGSADADIN